jgi:class 3 adenylate cyclase
MTHIVPIPPHSPAGWPDTADPHPAGPLVRSVHCAMLAVDIAAFGGRDPATQQYLHASLYRIVPEACEAAGLPWNTCHHEDRGDGILLIAPAGLSPELLDPAAVYLSAGIRRHNELANADAKIQLRMALHAGYIRRGPEGVSGRDLIHLFRLLDAPELKARLAAGHADFALIASDDLYNDVIRHGPSLIPPATYQQVKISNKETHTSAWIWLPVATPSTS